jgi:hypothetical protein
MDPIVGFSVVSAPESSAKMVIVPFRIPSTQNPSARTAKKSPHARNLLWPGWLVLQVEKTRISQPFGETVGLTPFFFRL